MGSETATPPQDKTSLQGLASGIGKLARRGPAPVHLWNPPYCGDIGLAIDSDGNWSYGGSPIRRAGMVQLFASVLRRDDDQQHYLVTPVEKIAVSVADAPFLAVEMQVSGDGRSQTISLRTNLDEWVEVDADHPLRFEEQGPDRALKPYLLVRGRLEARVTRALVYDLIDRATSRSVKGTAMLGVWSSGTFFPIGPDSGGGE